MIRQKYGKTQKRKSKNFVVGSKKKKTKKLNISQMSPSQVNGNKDKGGQGNKTVLTTQNDGKVKKKKILKKGTLQTKAKAGQINIEDNNDKKVTVTPQANK